MWNRDSKTKNFDDGKKPSVDLSDVIKGMQHAVNEAEKMLETHNLRSIKNFFYEDGDPKTVELHLDEDNYLEVPILALANHSSLMIDRLTMEFEAKIEQVGIHNTEDVLGAVRKDGEDSESTTERNARFSVGFSGQPDSNSLKVRLEFRAAAQPEGLSRILDEYNKLVVPYTAIEGEDASPWKRH